MVHLGIPLSNNKLKARDFRCLIDKINKKFNHWNIRLLNSSGRIEPVKTVIYPMIQFWIQFSPIPASITNRINSICTNLLWKSKSHSMSWEDMCKTKREGGFGIRKIEDIGKSISIKLIWKFIQGVFMVKVDVQKIMQ